MPLDEIDEDGSLLFLPEAIDGSLFGSPRLAFGVGRDWHEWVIGRKNKRTEQRSKKIIYALHLEPRFGKMRLDEIPTPKGHTRRTIPMTSTMHDALKREASSEEHRWAAQWLSC